MIKSAMSSVLPSEVSDWEKDIEVPGLVVN